MRAIGADSAWRAGYPGRRDVKIAIIDMRDQSFTPKTTGQPIGLMALIEELELSVRKPTVRSWTRSGARKTIITTEAIKEYYPPIYAPSGIIGNLKFALRYEPVDLSVYNALFKVLNAELLEGWIKQEPIYINSGTQPRSRNTYLTA